MWEPVLVYYICANSSDSTVLRKLLSQSLQNLGCVLFLAWVLGQSSRGRGPMRCYSVSRNTRSGFWRWWSDASTSGSSLTGTMQTPCPDSSRRPRSSPVQSFSQCWRFFRYLLNNQTIYSIFCFSWVSVPKNKGTCILYMYIGPLPKLGIFFQTKEAQKFTCPEFQPMLTVFQVLLLMVTMITPSLMLLRYLPCLS